MTSAHNSVNSVAKHRIHCFVSNDMIVCCVVVSCLHWWYSTRQSALSAIHNNSQPQVIADRDQCPATRDRLPLADPRLSCGLCLHCWGRGLGWPPLFQLLDVPCKWWTLCPMTLARSEGSQTVGHTCTGRTAPTQPMLTTSTSSWTSVWTRSGGANRRTYT